MPSGGVGGSLNSNSRKEETGERKKIHRTPIPNTWRLSWVTMKLRRLLNVVTKCSLCISGAHGMVFGAH